MTLRRSACALALTGSFSVSLASTPPSAPVEPVEAFPAGEIAPGVHVHVGALAFWPDDRYPAGDLANLSYVIGTECVAVIDSGGSGEAGQRLLASIRAHTPLPVCFVINTGGHAPHMLGNHVFAQLQPRPNFISHASLPDMLHERGERQASAMGMPASAVVIPDLLVDSELAIDLGERELHLRTWPNARSDTELTVFDRTSRTLWTGDLLYTLHLPHVDGSLLGWIDALTPLALLEADRVVPGHGPVSTEWPAVLQPQRDYLENLAGEATSAWQQRHSLSSLIASSPQPDWLLAGMLHPLNLTAAYIEVSRD